MRPSTFLEEFAANNDQVKCRCIGFEDFGAPLDTATNDVPLQDMYNTGLVAPMDGMQRNPLNIEGQVCMVNVRLDGLHSFHGRRYGIIWCKPQTPWSPR
jgi:hypothetical protein